MGYDIFSCTGDSDCPPDAECVDATELDDVDSEEYESVCVDELGSPLEGELSELVADVACSFDDASTSFVRTDNAERVQRPATARFEPDVELIEGQQLTFDVHNHETTFEVLGIEPIRDKRRGTLTAVRAELERAD